MKKRTVITIILFTLFVVLLIVGIILVAKDMEISHEVADKAEAIKEEILNLPEGAAGSAIRKAELEAEFTEYLNSKTPVQTTLTLTSLVLIGGGIGCFVAAIKRVAADIKAKRDEEEKGLRKSKVNA